MARPKSDAYQRVRGMLIQRSQSGYYVPGAKFLTNRAVCKEYGISYVTAHRLLNDLCQEGYLERRTTSGTFIPGTLYNSVHLIFHPGVKWPNSYANLLIQELSQRLDQAGISWQLSRTDTWKDSPPKAYPVLWHPDLSQIVEDLNTTRRYALLMNQQPPPGVASSYLDNIDIDFFSGGVMAGQILSGHCKRVGIVAGTPLRKRETEEYVRGFRTIWPQAPLIGEDQTTFQLEPPVMQGVLDSGWDGVFCIIQRHAIALMDKYEELKRVAPRIVLADYPPRQPRLRTPFFISVPLEEIAEAAMRVIRKRMAGNLSVTERLVLVPRSETI